MSKLDDYLEFKEKADRILHDLENIEKAEFRIYLDFANRPTIVVMCETKEGNKIRLDKDIVIELVKVLNDHAKTLLDDCEVTIEDTADRMRQEAKEECRAFLEREGDF